MPRLSGARASLAEGFAPGGRDGSLLAGRRTRTALATLLGLLLLLAGVAVFATYRLYRTSEDRYVKEAFPLRTGARDLVLQMLNEETGVRGYLVTGNRRTLLPYRRGRTAVHADLAALERLSSRRADIQPEVARLRVLVTSLEGYFGRQIALASTGPAGRLAAQGNVLVGSARFDRFRVGAAKLSARADQIVVDAEASQHATFWRTLALVLVAAAAAVAIGITLLLVVPGRMRSLYRREADLRRAAERGASAARALAHVDDAVALLDGDGIVRYWNPAAAGIFGISEHDALHRTAREVLPDFDTIEQALERAHGGVLVPLSIGGAERWFLVNESRFAAGRVLVLRDVTADQQLERARGEFLATASHELRTPLAAVYGAVRTLRRPDRPDEPELEQRLLSMIEEESERLARIIDQILVSARLDQGELTLDVESFDLRELCESAIASAELRAGPGHTLTLDGPEAISIECDPGRLRQVIVNLLDNALKYSPAGGNVAVRLRDRQDRVTIEVEDEGIGIPADAHRHVFEKFFRADPDMLRGVGGSGLGLYISRALLDQMGGEVRLRSRPGEGTTFTVDLPRRVAPVLS